MSMRLTVIGCSSGMPSGKSSASCYLLEGGGRKYLLDCGDGSASAFVRLGIDPNIISHIFISHMHPDHCMGLPLLVQMMYLQKRISPLEIFLPREAEDGFKRLFYMTYLFFEKLGFEISFRGIEKGFTFSDGNISISFFQNSHLFGNKEYILRRTLPNRMQCYSMIIEAGGKKLVYSADIGSIDDLEPIIENADLLLTEGMHLDLDKLPTLLIEKKVKKVMLTHLAENSDSESIKAVFQKAGIENISFAQEGMTICI